MHYPTPLAAQNTLVDRIMMDLVRQRERQNLVYVESRVNSIAKYVPAHAHELLYKLYICRAVIAYYRRNFMEALYHIQQSDRLHFSSAVHRDYERVKSHILTRACLILGQVRQEQVRNQKTYLIVQRGFATLGFSAICLVAGLIMGSQAYDSGHKELLLALATGALYAWGISLCLALYQFLRSALRVVA